MGVEKSVAENLEIDHTSPYSLRCRGRKEWGIPVMKVVISASGRLARTLGVVVAAGLMGAFSLCDAAAGQTTAPRASDVPLRDSWRTSIAKVPLPHEGCFTASYPDMKWTEVVCVVAPSQPFHAEGASHDGADTVGATKDYAAVVTGHISSASGSFPAVSGLKKEQDGGEANMYALQLNSNFMPNDKSCRNAADPSLCHGWQQFIYSNHYQQAFMQYWLGHFDEPCPAGWTTHKKDGSTDCFVNSAAVSVPSQNIDQLLYLSVTGSAVAKGLDTVVVTTQEKAYSTTGKDTMEYLANYWNTAEFNVFGDGGGTEAVFNKGTSITVEIDVTNGRKVAPVCEENDGTTAETNNLVLGPCKATRGTTPSVSFTESLSK
jgi:hypothetical protein